MKRILIFRPTLGSGGADRVTTTLLKHLDRARFRIELALVRVEGPFVADVPSDVVVHDLGVPRLARAVPALARLLRRTRPDIVFSTASAANPIASIAHGLARSRARLVLSERNAFFRGRPDDLKQRIEVQLKRWTYPRADVVTAVSQGVGDQLVAALSLPPDRVQVVYNPMVDLDLAPSSRVPVDHQWFADASVPVIVACARLVAQKDYPSLLEAFRQIRQHTPARLFVLGDGPLRRQLVDLAGTMGLGDHVHFHGFDKNPFRFMARARLLMHASITEGLPGALIQAMACGTPVVSTDCDFGPREVIQAPGVDGILTPVGRPALLAEAALSLLRDPARRERMAQAAQQSAQRFTVEASLARYTTALEG